MKKTIASLGHIATSAGDIPLVNSFLSPSDIIGSVMARMTINRMNYRVGPGMYAIGNPTFDSPVFVTANYKLTFDTLRSQLKGISAWIMTLDTKGVNVWCAAAKGTFGTNEMVHRIRETGLAKIVSHRTLIVPQLGAPGIAALEVRRDAGFSVRYGPVRASDIPHYLKTGMRATPKMRLVDFSFIDRIVLIPAEIASIIRYGVLAAIGVFLLSGFGRAGFSPASMYSDGTTAALNITLSFFAGAVVTPLLLPWLPGRSFSMKGLVSGIAIFLLAVMIGMERSGIFGTVAWMLMMPAIASFLAMQFTGASTYTSLSGVKHEMRLALPLQIAFIVIGFLFWILARFK